MILQPIWVGVFSVKMVSFHGLLVAQVAILWGDS